MTGSVFLLQRICCPHSSQHYTRETKSHSSARYSPKDWYCMFQSELAELTLWVAIKIPWFLSLVRQIGPFDNLGPLPWKCGYASICWLIMGTESTESLAEGGDLKTREGGGEQRRREEGKGRAVLDRLFTGSLLAAREAIGWAGSVFSGGSFRPSIWGEKRCDVFMKQIGLPEAGRATSDDGSRAMTSVWD